MLSWQKRNLSLVMSNAKDDGRKAPKILRNHYRGKIKPHVLALYTELTMSALWIMFYTPNSPLHCQNLLVRQSVTAF